MADAWHVEWLKEGVSTWNYRRKRVDFTPDLSGIRFFDLLPPDFRDAPKTSRFFEKLDLKDANLEGADLSDLNFTGAKFDRAKLSGCDLSLSNFTNASFKKAILESVTVHNSIFDGATFEGVDLADSEFQEVSALGANFIDVVFSDTQASALGVTSQNTFASRAEFLKRLSVGETERFSEAPPKLTIDNRTNKNRYDVFFGTNRRPDYERGVLTGFSGEHDSVLRFGVCEVIVPEGHRVGSLGSSLFRRLRNRQDDRLRLDRLISLNEDLFFEFVIAGAQKMKIKQKPTIFVHGFNNTFENAVLRAAQIGYDLGIGQGVGLFSWPSKGQFLKYKTDEASVEASKYYLAHFIEKFVKKGGSQGVNLIAHSMGCRCLLGAIEVLSVDRKDILDSIDQVILAAADVDTALMPNIGKATVSASSRSTSYVSDRDWALKLSGWLHSFPRVGITPPAFVMNGLDTIVVNGLDLGDAKHGYVGTSRTVLGDIFELLKSGTPPEQRFTLEGIVVPTGEIWKLKD